MNKSQLFTGLAALAVGGIFYVFYRQPEAVYLMPSDASLYESTPQREGVFWNSFPSFLHTLAFILITTGALNITNKVWGLIVCLFWLVIDILLEFGQNGNYNSAIIELIPDWFSKVPVLEVIEPYFLYGEFEISDILASALGAIFAYFIYIKTRGHTA